MRRLGARDLELNPYTLDERRILTYLTKLNPEVDTNGDPVGFLIRSHTDWRNAAGVLQDSITKLTEVIDNYEDVGLEHKYRD